MALPGVRWVVALGKGSPWLLIAVGLHVIVAAGMSVVYIRHELAKNAVQPTQITVARPSEPAPETLDAPEVFDRYKIPEQDRRMELVTEDEVQAFVPSEVSMPEDLYEDVGDPTGSDASDPGIDSSTNIGVGDKGGHRGRQTSPFGGRRPGSGQGLPGGRALTIEPQGTQEAVLEGLRWLIRHQNEDGSWGAETVTLHCNPKHPCIPPEAVQDASYDLGMTSLALLAFLGHGISMESKLEIVDTAKAQRHVAGDVVKGGVRWLTERQHEDGSFSDSGAFEHPENETLSTMVLCEAHGLSPNREVKRQAQLAVNFLVDAQKRRADGSRSGWGMGSRADLEARFARGELEQADFAIRAAAVDLSITCWVVMALRSAQSCGFEVPEEVLHGAVTYAVEEAAAEPLEGGAAASSGADDRFDNHVARRAALSMLILSFGGTEVSDPLLEAAAREIAEDVPKVTADQRSIDFYYWYFATLALYQYDGPDSPRAGAGEYWEPWNKGLVKALLPLQDKDREREACGRGGWLSEARGNQRGRALYNTALNVLTLEVYYRYENVFR